MGSSVLAARPPNQMHLSYRLRSRDSVERLPQVRPWTDAAGNRRRPEPTDSIQSTRWKTRFDALPVSTDQDRCLGRVTATGTGAQMSYFAGAHKRLRGPSPDRTTFGPSFVSERRIAWLGINSDRQEKFAVEREVVVGHPC